MTTTRTILIAARKKLSMTQEDLSTKVGISRAYLTNIENGKYTPSLEVAKKIASALSMSIDDLF